jgi:flagellar basal-body rod protein FlgB
MLKTMYSANAITVLEKSISFHAQRQRVITSNIANAMTPYYQAKDLPAGEFYQTLNKAIEERRTTGNPRFLNFDPTSMNLRVDSFGNPRMRDVYSGEVNTLRHDGNNVDISMEMSKLAQNSLMHNALVTLINQEFRTLTAAIRGRM